MLRTLALVLALGPVLAACNSAPEQPSETPNTLPDLQPENRSTEPLVPPPPPLAPSAVLGAWAIEEEQCLAVSGPPVTISANRFESSEESCDVSELVAAGAAFTASLSCEREGLVDAKLLKLTPDGDSLTLSWIGTDRADTILQRCE